MRGVEPIRFKILPVKVSEPTSAIGVGVGEALGRGEASGVPDGKIEAVGLGTGDSDVIVVVGEVEG